MSCELAKKSKKVIGIDHDKEAIERAKNVYKMDNLDFICEDVFDYINNTKQKFNILILSHILEHIVNPEELINKAKIYFDKIYIELPDFDKTYLNHYRQKEGAKLIYADLDHIWEFDRLEMEDLIKKCDLTIIESEYRFGMMKYWCKC